MKQLKYLLKDGDYPINQEELDDYMSRIVDPTKANLEGALMMIYTELYNSVYESTICDTQLIVEKKIARLFQEIEEEHFSQKERE